MVSIIIPVYNVEKYLDKCLASVVNQTFKDIEIILIDDGSTDKSGEICLEWQRKDKRIIYIKKKNEGQGVARNLGVKISKGDYITFVDSDDWIELNAVESMCNAAKRFGVDIVVTDINYVTEDGCGNLVSKISKLRIDSDECIKVSDDIRLIDTARLNLWGKLYTREFYMNNYIEQPNHAFEDAVVVPLLIAKANTLYHLPKAVYNYYRSRTDSTMNSRFCYGDLPRTLGETKNNFVMEGLFDKYYEALKKISYAQIRFIYKKLLGEKKEVDFKYKKIIEELYDFMDEVYPDWINIDKYNIGYIGKEILAAAIKNTVFNNWRVEKCESDNERLASKDIIILDLVDDMFYKNSELWAKATRKRLKDLQNHFNGKKIILVKFENSNCKEECNIIDDIYDEYKNSNLNMSVINFNGIDDIYDENKSWDLSDEILKKLMYDN